MEYSLGLVFLVVIVLGIWKGSTWLWRNLTSPKGYAIVAGTAAGILVIPIAADSSPAAETEALRKARQTLKQRGALLKPFRGELTPSSSHVRRARQVKVALEQEGYVVGVVDGEFLEIALESEDDPFDDQALMPEVRSVWERVGEDDRRLTPPLGHVVDARESSRTRATAAGQVQSKGASGRLGQLLD